MSWKLRLFKSTMLPGFRMKLASLLKSHPEKTRSEIETYRNLINNAMKMSGAHADDGFSKVEGFEGEVFAQPNKTDKAIFFVHGGGFAIASPQYYRPYTKLLGEYSKFNVYAPNYGLSPENVYPHALEGVEKSYMWLTEKFDPKQISVVGDSAGGTLVAALLLKLHQNNLKELKPASCVLSSPFVSMTHEASKEAAKYGENDPILPMEHNGIDIVASLYLTGKHIYSKEGGYLDESQLDPKELQKFNELRENPLVSPLLCEDSILKEAFPTKTLIQCGDEEALKPQIVEFSKKINAELQIYESMFHSFQICGDFFSESDEALKDMSQFIKSSVSS